MATRRITLTPSFSPYADATIDGARLTVVASSAVGVPPEVFAYRDIPLAPGGTSTQSVFSHVCSPTDLEEFPVGSPLVNASPPWFRTATVDLVFRSRSTAERAWRQLRDDVTNLIHSLKALDDLEALAPVVLGDP